MLFPVQCRCSSIRCFAGPLDWLDVALSLCPMLGAQQYLICIWYVIHAWYHECVCFALVIVTFPLHSPSLEGSGRGSHESLYRLLGLSHRADKIFDLWGDTVQCPIVNADAVGICVPLYWQFLCSHCGGH